MRVTVSAMLFHQLPNPDRLAAVLVQLRWLALTGQTLAVVLADRVLGMNLPLAALASVLSAMTACNLFLTYDLRRHPARGLGRPLAQLALDLLALTLLLALSGAAANPFASLYLVPVALAAGTLPPRHVIAIAAGATLAYSALMLLPARLLHGQHLAISPFDLHLVGMWINFLLTAVIFVLFLARLAESGRMHALQLAELREKQLRDESLLGVGLLAASTAHELNTPLQSMRLLLDDALAGHALDTEDLSTLNSQLGRCQLHVRTLAELARSPRQTQVRWRADTWLAEALSRWRILHPALVLEETVATGLAEAWIAVDGTVRLALLNLLDNAAQAGLRAGDATLALHAEVSAGQLRLCITDQGSGWDAEAPRANRGGLGLGLKLSNASIERAGGSVELRPGTTRGTLTVISLPLLATPHE